MLLSPFSISVYVLSFTSNIIVACFNRHAVILALWPMFSLWLTEL